MLKVAIRPQWTIAAPDGAVLLPRLLEILVEVSRQGNLAAACRTLGLSYRHAWGIVREGQTLFGRPLLTMERGRGSVLTELGAKLVWADRRVTARLGPSLDSLASELEAEIESMLRSTSNIMHIHASHGFAVETLRTFLIEAQVPIDLKYRSAIEAAASFASGGCDLAGFHVPEGSAEAAMLQHYTPYLNASGTRLIHLATRRLGLMLAPGNPKEIFGILDLARPGLRFINRQHGSATRALLDFLCREAGVDTTRVLGFQEGEYTHAAVAAFIASGMADAGFGIETPARHFNLEFIPLETERYFLACRTEALNFPQMQDLLRILASPSYRHAVDQLPGYDARASGRVLMLSDAFPALGKKKRP
jgi:molybdate transport repressor ModE-like protein